MRRAPESFRLSFSKVWGVALAVLLATGVQTAKADFTFVTAVGKTAGGQPVDATATFHFSVDQLTVTIRNLQSNPTSDIQSINGIAFSVSPSETVATLTGSSAVQRTITSHAVGGFSDSATPLTTNWNLNFGVSGFKFELTTIGNPMAKETIIGDPALTGAYSAANSSIFGSNHNPFLTGTATFTLSIPGVTAATTIAGMQFEFGTAAGTNAPGTLTAVPEPASLSLIGIGLGGAFVVGLRNRRRIQRAGVVA
jgi:hypothetical protein